MLNAKKKESQKVLVSYLVTGLDPRCTFRHMVVKAGAGRNHTVVVTEDGLSLGFGWNKHGQLGSGSLKEGVCNCKFVPYATD